VDGWLAFELHESATRATSHRASGGLPVVHKGRSDAGGRSPARGRLVVVQGESHHCRRDGRISRKADVKVSVDPAA
jgi:hypothetical protein